MATVEKKIIHKNTHFGPGGYGCPCCSPPLSHRKVVNRAVKRGKLKEYVRKEVQDQTERGDG